MKSEVKNSAVIAQFVRMAGIAVASVILLPVAFAQEPVPKKGPCPSGYHTSGSYCVPSGASSKPTLPKIGPCPNGYYTSGNYCLATEKEPRIAVPKNGPCPSGYHTSGGYCVSSSKPK